MLLLGDRGLASSIHSGVNGHIFGSSNANEKQWQSYNVSYSYPVEMDLTLDYAPNETTAPIPKLTYKSGIRFLGRKKLLYLSNKRRGAWSPSNAKGPIPQKLANRLKDKFRAEIVADCRAQHFEECRRDTEASIKKALGITAKDHADKLESQRILAEKAIRDSRGDCMNQLKLIQKLEQAKKAVESEAEAKDERIRDLEADIQKYAAAAEKAAREAQADSKQKAKHIHMLRKAKEAAVHNAAKKVTDLQAENVALKEQIDDFKEDLRASTFKVEDLETVLIQQQPLPEANEQAESIMDLTDSVDQLKSIVAEQAETLANSNSIMVHFKDVNERLVKELASQRSKETVLEDKAAGLLQIFYAERQKKEDLEKQVAEQAAIGLKLTVEAPAEAMPTTKASSTIIVQDYTAVSKSTTLVTSAAAPAPTKLSFRNIFDNPILLGCYFLFGNGFLTFSLLSLVIFSTTRFFLSASSNLFQTDLSTEGETEPVATNRELDREIAEMPGGWGWWEED